MKAWLGCVLLAFSFNLLAWDAQELEIPHGAQEGAALVEEAFQSGRSVLASSTFIFTNSDKNAQYPAGDFVIMWGVGPSSQDQGITRDEYTRIWRIMNYLSGKGFRVIMDVRANNQSVRQAVETQGTSVVLYSGHGNTSGFYDYNGERISYDLFANKANSVYQFILSACYGSQSRGHYAPPADLVMYTWSGLTNSTDLENFLMGDWTGLEGKILAVRN